LQAHAQRHHAGIKAAILASSCANPLSFWTIEASITSSMALRNGQIRILVRPCRLSSEPRSMCLAEPFAVRGAAMKRYVSAQTGLRSSVPGRPELGMMLPTARQACPAASVRNDVGICAAGHRQAERRHTSTIVNECSSTWKSPVRQPVRARVVPGWSSLFASLDAGAVLVNLAYKIHALGRRRFPRGFSSRSPTWSKLARAAL